MCIFFPSILQCCHTIYHPQGDLAMFGYRPAMKVGFIYSCNVKGRFIYLYNSMYVHFKNFMVQKQINN